MSELEKQTHELVDNLLKSDLFQKYFKVKKLLENDAYFKNLNGEIKRRKKYLSKYKFEELTLEIHKIKMLEDEYDNYPLNITYKNLKNEIEDLIQPLYDIFK